MRRKEQVRDEAPLRRSGRRQREKVDDQVPSEDSNTDEANGALVLQPRASIRAHRTHPAPASDPSPMLATEPSSTSATEPLPVLAREPPLSKLQDGRTRNVKKRGLTRRQASESPKSSGQAAQEQNSPLSPFVRLKRLEISEEEDETEEPFLTRNNSSGERKLETPNVEWQVVRDERARLQVLERGPSKTRSAPVSEIAAPRLRGTAASSTPRLKGTALHLQGGVEVAPRLQSAGSRLRSMAETGTPKRQGRAPWADTTAPGMKPTKRFLFPSRLCFLLPFLLILGAAGWFVWVHGSPASLLDQIHTLRLWRGPEEECSTQCSLELVESIPVGLRYSPASPRHPSIYQAWMDLLSGANSTVDIAAFYFTLRDSDTQEEEPSSLQVRKVFEKLLDLPSRGVKLSIAVNSPQKSDRDTQDLARNGADIRYVEMEQLTGGIVHTKFWVVDRKHIYIGSANMDWRSLTQVKELGAVLYNCSCLAGDLLRIFAMYRALGEEGASVPAEWPAALSARSSLAHPLTLQLNGTSAELYLSSSPPALCSAGRTPDLSAIISTIEDAQAFIYISVMDYVPECSFCKPKRFWPVIDNALRAAACQRKVNVRLLISCWQHSARSMFVFLESLSILSQEPLGCPIEVKLFVVPATEEQERIPFTRVNHNKYMVTDRLAYIGTSNWSESYFSQTAGVGLIVNQTEAAAGTSGPNLRQQLEAVFHRDWGSSHVQPLRRNPSCATRPDSGQP
uniref:PLD phosphodiesterase domain-containing protein n=1 Tax=Sphenodon punctatus TaxID=8508 RepID=A0A8D0GTY3_SPHPU